MVVIYVAVIIIAFTAASGILSSMVEQFLVLQRTQEHIDEASLFADTLLPLLDLPNSPTLLYNEAVNWTRQHGGRLVFLDADAVVRMDTASLSNGYKLPYREVREIILNDEPSAYGFHRVPAALAQTDAQRSQGSYKWAVNCCLPIENGGDFIGVLLYSVSIQQVKDSVSLVINNIIILFLVAALAIGLITLLVSNWLTRPIITLTTAMQRVGMQGYGERVKVRGGDEFSTLAEAFNIMSEKLEHHDKLRNEFVSNASHELKTPLSTMKILSETMLYAENPSENMAKEFFSDINSEVDRMTQIINDLLRLVQVEGAERALNIQNIDFEALVQGVMKRLIPLAKQKGIRLEKKLLPVYIYGDRLMIDQVVTNLIDNAIKYTEKGSVAVTLKPDGNFAVLTVHDTGEGIPKEYIPRLFERFYRVDKARSRATGGTGLGLSIVERIVSMHGGFISVDSVVNKGSTFTVRLPLKQTEGVKNEAEKSD